MKVNRTLLSIGLVLPTACGALFTKAQQPTATPDFEQEFFDAIRKGSSARVSELLKQQLH